jgi:hypothetical protein
VAVYREMVVPDLLFSEVENKFAGGGVGGPHPASANEMQRSFASLRMTNYQIDNCSKTCGIAKAIP